MLLAAICAPQTLRKFCLPHERYILFVPSVPTRKNRYLKKLTCFLIVSLLFQTAFLPHSVFSDSARSQAFAHVVTTRIYAKSAKPPAAHPRTRQPTCNAMSHWFFLIFTNLTIYKQSERLHIRPDTLTSPHCRVGRSVKPNELGGQNSCPLQGIPRRIFLNRPVEMPFFWELAQHTLSITNSAGKDCRSYFRER